MKKLFFTSQTSGALLLFSLIFSSACQPAQPSPSPTPFPTVPPLPASTPTDTILFSLPTTTASPTATAQPTITNTSVPLSSEGPWLVYTGKVSDSQGGVVSGQIMVNQDGTGKVPIPFNCYPGDTRESPSNRLIAFRDTIYLFDPTRVTWALVHRTWPTCGSKYIGDNEKGLLATRARGIEDIPELLIYELPGGKIRDRFPILFKCPEDDQACDTSNVEWWNFEMAWSPSGRYLAFAATLEDQLSEFGPSSDLYLYDVQTGKILRLTSGPDSVAQIWWSPDGKWIIMGELHESNYPFTTSVWAVSAADGEMRELYSMEDGYPQGILGWLDNSRFIVYSGTSLYDATDLPAYNLEIVDIDTGTLTSLFKGSFFGAALDREDETVAVAVYLTELRAGYEAGQGIYLFSTSNTTPRYVGSDELQSNWNDELKLFVTHKPCENDPEGTVAFDVNGKLQCLTSSLPDSYLSPDGKWQVSIETGVWLETNGKQPVQILEGKATQVIWRLDSAGFFLLAEGTPGSEQNLYYVSLPEATLNLINRYVYGPVEYQWLEK